MDIIELRGNNFEAGILLGKRFSSAIEHRLKCLNITKEINSEKADTVTALLKNCTEKAPELMEEIKGIAEGAGKDLLEIFCLNLLELPELNRCSTIISRDPEIIIAHNEDGDTFERKEDFAITKRVNDDLSVYNFTYPGELSGSSFCWNSKGLIIGVNNVRYRKLNVAGLPRTFIARMIIEAHSIEDAIGIIKKNICASGFHYTLAQDSRIISVEQHNNRVSVVEIDQNYYHTNHFLHNFFKDEMVITENSKKRYNRIKELLNENKDILSILFDRKNRPDSIYGDNTDENQTMATFLAYPMRNIVRVYQKDNAQEYIDINIK